MKELKVDLETIFPRFYALSSKILALYESELKKLPKVPFQEVLENRKELGGVYLMYTENGTLFNVGQTTDFKRRFGQYKCLWRKLDGCERYSETVKVSLVIHPPREDWPSGLHGPQHYRMEWFIQLAVKYSRNDIYKNDLSFFWDEGPGDEDMRIRESEDFVSPT